MKKSLILIAAFCLSLGIRSNAQNSFPLPILSSIFKDTLSVATNSNEDVLDTLSIFIHAEDHRSKVMFGLKGGFNRSNVYNGSTGFYATPVMGWVAGVFMTLPLNKLFGFQPEFLYAQKGFKTMGTVDENEYAFKRKTIYVDIPLLLQFKPNKSISLFAGPLLSFLIHTKDTFENGPITAEQKQAITNGVIRKNIIGAEGGVSIYVQHVVVSLRAGWDLQNLNDSAPSNSRRYENAWMQATVGYMF